MYVDLLEAENIFPELMAAAEAGEAVVLMRDGKPVAKIVRLDVPAVPAELPTEYPTDLTS